MVGMPAALSSSASAVTSSIPAGLGSNGPVHVVPGASMWMTPGAATRPAGSVTPRMTRAAWRAATSSLPMPFWTLHTAASRRDAGGGGHRRLSERALGGHDAEVARRDLVRGGPRAHAPDELGVAGHAQAV